MAKRIVKQGETGLQIAEELGISYSSLLSANPGVSSIRPGVTLRIPTTASLTQGEYGPKGYTGPKDTSDPGLPPTPYVPPPPASGDYGPKGYPKKPGTQTPYTEKPPPYIPPVQQPRPQPTYIPPAQSMAGLEAARVPQQPVVGLTGAQPQPPGWAIQPGTLQGKVVGYLNRLFNRQPGVFREQQPQPERPVVSYTGAQRPNYYQQFLRSTPFDPAGWRALGQGLRGTARQVGGAIERAQEQAGTPTQDLGPTVGRWFKAGREGAFGEIPTAEELAAQQAKDPGGDGILWYRMMMGDGNTRMFQWSWNEETTQEELLEQRGTHVGRALRAGDKPQIILESDRKLLGYSPEDMMEIGYYWDAEKEQWIYGVKIEEPQTYGAAAPYGGGYYYPRGGGGGGGGGWSYPSYLPRENQPYPQSFVGRGQAAPYPQSFVRQGARGMTPQQAQTGAARFGAVNWRIG